MKEINSLSFLTCSCRNNLIWKWILYKGKIKLFKFSNNQIFRGLFNLFINLIDNYQFFRLSQFSPFLEFCETINSEVPGSLNTKVNIKKY